MAESEARDVAVLLSAGCHPASGRARRAELDARALELALTECEGSRIHAIHAGDPGQPALRDYLGMGIPALTVLPARDGEVLALLAAHLKHLNPAVILCGAAAEHGEGSGMLPYLLAEALGAQLVAGAISVALRGDTARITQALPRGARRALRVALPVVLTVDRTAPAARMSAWGPAQRGTIEVRSHAITGAAAPGLAHPAAAAPQDAAVVRPARIRPRRLKAMGQGSALERLRSISAIGAGTGSRLEGLDPAQAALAIWRFLQDEGLADAVPAGPSASVSEPSSSPSSNPLLSGGNSGQ